MQENEQVNINTNRSELLSLSFRDLFYKYVRFLPLFLLSVAFALFIAYIYLRYATPIYSAGGTMLIKSEQKGGGGGNDKFEDVFVGSRGSNIQNEIEVLKSKPLMERVVKKLGLQFNYYVKGKIKTINIYKQGAFLVEPVELADSLRPFSWKVKFINDHAFRINDDKTVISFGQYFKNANGLFRVNRNPYGGVSKEYNVTYQPAYSSAGTFAGSLQISPKTPGTGILLISLQTTNAQMGSDVINGIMDEYGQYSIEEKIKSADQMIAFIDERLIDYGRIRDSIQRAYLNMQKRYNLFDASAQSGTYFGNITEADRTINSQRMNMNIADMIDEYLMDKKNEFTKVPVVPSSLGLTDPTLNVLIAEYNKAQLERQQDLDANITPNSPTVTQINGQIEQLRISIRENLKNIKNSVTANINSTLKRSSESESQLKQLPSKTNELAEIKRGLDAYQNLFTLLQTKRLETSISRASTIPNSSIVERSYPSNTPVKPNRRSIQILAILLGVGLPALIIFIGEILNDKVTTRFDIEKITPVPILGEIGHSYSTKALVVNKTTRSMVAEQFRIIRSNLQYILSKSDKSILLVTSSFSGEGKSYISTNMGAVMALAGKKTIILEFDIRKPKVLSGLGIAKGPGITNFLVGKARLDELIKPVHDQENLFVLGCGPVPPNPAELLLDQRVEEMFTWLRTNFDVVIVDTAPIGMVSDAMTLSKFADATLYLVRQGHTFKKQVVLIDEFYRENKLPKVSIIINDIKMKPGYGYYGYGRYGYGYGYGYGSYYEEEVPPKNLFERLMGLFDVTKIFRGKK